MKTTFGVPLVLVALVASLAVASSLGPASSGARGVEPGAMPESAATTDLPAGGRRIAGAFPTPEAGFAISRAVVDRRESH